MPFQGDPLLIYYILAINDDGPELASPFQGFGRSFAYLPWALHAISRLPADVLENSSDLTEIIAQRMGGMRAIAWLPLNVSALEAIERNDLGVFLVVFSGEVNVAERVSRWATSKPGTVLHVSSIKVDGALAHDSFDQAALKGYCQARLATARDAMSPDRYETATNALGKWIEREPISIDLPRHGHNALMPNQMVLERAGRSLLPGEPYMGRHERDYADRIVESCRAVMAIRETVGFRPFHAMTLYPPDLIITEPALFRHVYKGTRRASSEEDRAGAHVMKMLRQQKGLISQTTAEMPSLLDRFPLARGLLQTRQFELETHALSVGIRAAETCSAVLRLSPGVNHVFPELSAFARNVRSPRPEARMKSRRLFETIQAKLAEAVGPDRLAYISEQGPAVKIVADAPLEWLPVDNLPLCLRMDTSRVNATPGNVMLGQMVTPRAIRFEPNDLQKVLVVSSFEDGDPLRQIMVRSIMAIRPRWEGKVDVIFKTVHSRSQLIEALNSYDGNILVFDGHGSANDVEPVGKLLVGKEEVDVWSLRGVARIPMIVVLSACDTHGIDSSSHATVGNGLLAWGARSVLATMLPVGGTSSASLVARLIYRLADFLPAALSARKRVLNWTEVVAGMLRMLFASEILDRLVGPITDLRGPRFEIQRDANVDINSYNPKWFDRLLERIAEFSLEDPSSIQSKARGVIARSEAIRYVQLGNPEKILIDDGTIRSQFIPAGPIMPLSARQVDWQVAN